MRYLTPRTALLGRGILSDQVPKVEELAARCYAKRWFKPRLLNGSLGLRIPSDCGSPYGLAAYPNLDNFRLSLGQKDFA